MNCPREEGQIFPADSSQSCGGDSHHNDERIAHAGRPRKMINCGWIACSERRPNQVEEIKARLELACLEENKDAIAYTSRCFAITLANRRHKNRKKHENRKKNKQMRKQYEAGLTSVINVVPSMDVLCIRDIPDLQSDQDNDERVSGNGPVLHDSAGAESISGSIGLLPRWM